MKTNSQNDSEINANSHSKKALNLQKSSELDTEMQTNLSKSGGLCSNEIKAFLNSKDIASLKYISDMITSDNEEEENNVQKINIYETKRRSSFCPPQKIIKYKPRNSILQPKIIKDIFENVKVNFKKMNENIFNDFFEIFSKHRYFGMNFNQEGM